MPAVLVTGFEPFQQQSSNPSSRLARALHSQIIAGRPVVGVELPCVFQRALQELRQHLQRLQPELVICLGQAGGRSAISLERVAINIDDASIPDNAGGSPVDQLIEPQGPVAYWSRLPLKAIVQTLRQANIPAEVSQSAGTFVCNHVFYGLMHSLAERPDVRGGFIHVPYTPEQGKPNLPLEVMSQAIELAIQVSLTRSHDLRLSGGATH